MRYAGDYFGVSIAEPENRDSSKLLSYFPALRSTYGTVEPQLYNLLQGLNRISEKITQTRLKNLVQVQHLVVQNQVNFKYS